MAALSEIVVPAYTLGERPSALSGTARQVEWAKSIRPKILKLVRDAGRTDIAAALEFESDATWWIANRNRFYSDIRWPDSWKSPSNHSVSFRSELRDFLDKELKPKREMVTLRAIFGQRKCSYPGEFAPEFLDGMDEFGCNENGEWIEEKLEEHRKNTDFVAVALVDIKVPYDVIREKLSGIPEIVGEVDKPAGPGMVT